MSPTPPEPGGLDTYEKLVESIALWLGRNDLNEQIPTFIGLAEADMSRGMNLREQETFQDGETIANQDFLDLPDDLQIPRQLVFNTDPLRIVNIVSIDMFQAIKEGSGSAGEDQPVSATMVGDRLYLSPAPTRADPYRLYYLGRLIPLSSSNSTNRILKDAPDALLYGALMHSAPYIGDDARVQLWGTMYVQAKEAYRLLEWRSRTSGGPLRVRPDYSVDDRHNVGGS